MTDDQLQRYLQAVEKVRAGRTAVVDAQTRREIAGELHLSDEDIAAARAAGEAHLQRGEGHLGHASWDDAVHSLGEADALLPDDVRVLDALARAYWGRHSAEGAGADRERALATSRRCLELDPRHEASFRRIAEIGKKAPMHARRRRVLALAAAGAMVAAGATGVVVVTRAPSAVHPQTPTSNMNPALAVSCPDGKAYCTVPVDVRVTGDLSGDEVQIAPARLQLGTADPRIEIAGRLTHRGATELDRLSFAVHLLDAAEREVGRRALTAQPFYAPALRAGESSSFHLSEPVPPTTRRVELSVTDSKVEPAPGAYPPGQPVPLVFAATAPARIALQVAYRKRNASLLDNGKTLVVAELEVTNTGQGAIRQLELSIQAQDTAGAALGDPMRYTIVNSLEMPMAPGEQRVLRATLRVQGPVAGEKVTVTKVE